MNRQNDILVVVGHNQKSQGTLTLWGETEWQYNMKLVEMLDGVDIYVHPSGLGYTAQNNELKANVDELGYKYIFELHLNSYNGFVQRSEGLYYDGNVTGKHFAHLFSKHFNSAFGIDYGVPKPRTKNDLGGGFLGACKATSLILEPFFCDHKDAYMFKDKSAYAKFLKEYFKLCLDY